MDRKEKPDGSKQNTHTHISLIFKRILEIGSRKSTFIAGEGNLGAARAASAMEFSSVPKH